MEFLGQKTKTSWAKRGLKLCRGEGVFTCRAEYFEGLTLKATHLTLNNYHSIHCIYKILISASLTVRSCTSVFCIGPLASHSWTGGACTVITGILGAGPQQFTTLQQ